MDTISTLTETLTPRTGTVRLRLETPAGRVLLVGPFASLGGARRLAEDLHAEQPPAVRSVRVEHRQRGHGWKPAWSWLLKTSVVTPLVGLVVTVGGCAPYLVPLQGQTEAQTRQDALEAAKAHRAEIVAQAVAVLVVGVLAMGPDASDHAYWLAYGKAHTECLDARGYRMKTPEDYR